MEKRKPLISKSSELPNDYLKMVSEVFETHFDEGLKIYRQIKPESYFEASGAIFSDEVVVSISLTTPNHLAATTVYASSDFDPKANAPTLQELLSACVDAIAEVFSPLLSPEAPDTIKHLSEESVASLENVPFLWTSLEINKRKIFVKLDKSNPKLDSMTDDWLRKHDPLTQEQEINEQKDTEKLFFTGPTSLQKPTKKH